MLEFLLGSSKTASEMADKYGADAGVVGKTALVTGANSGIGLETAKILAANGCNVIMACRNEEKAQEAMDVVEETAKAQVTFLQLDLASFASIRRAAKEVLRKHNKLHYLINNAGVMACPRSETEDGYEMQLGTNHLGHFMLTMQLIDLLHKSGPARIVNVSSTAHQLGYINFDDLNSEKSYNEWLAYGQAKLANIYFTMELDRRLKAKNARIEAFCLHPGVINTGLKQHLFSGVQAIMSLWPISRLLKTIPQGAATTLYATLAPELDGQGGSYLVDCAVGKAWLKADADDEARDLWDWSAKQTRIGASL
eukprot:Clim_evm11s19 gene=Clim_evmTU11s19